MEVSLVMTIIGKDRTGLVESVASLVAEHEGNWLESRMCRLGGAFAGILRIPSPLLKIRRRWRMTLRGFNRKGYIVTVLLRLGTCRRSGRKTDHPRNHGPGPPGNHPRNLPRPCRPGGERRGIVQRVRQRAHDRRIPLQGASAIASSRNCPEAKLRQEMEKIASDLMVDISFAGRRGRSIDPVAADPWPLRLRRFNSGNIHAC